MASGLSHITFIVSDLERMSLMLTSVLEAKEVYSSGDDTFSLSQEKFFLVGDVWIAIMKGEPLAERTYNHVAFQISEDDYNACVHRIEALGLDMRPPRPRVEGEGRSIYFHDHDNHLFELHTGTLDQRLQRYARAKAG
ncbi:FosX/FosE/FosI family fosfomycin resistance hydrolase [Roseibium litorale]|uniref:FosX/FosE/FosI family fosfomycin resistance thiol transferase n=1 Tax=Roseibium litorale TaxID=2803841 RepID=A0ABR9CJZ9_9HYPH|nr:FosX/FosE/FosI family fosfomycin resistance hydrolase [Roseibium litorale]MBD8891167.1 FosX/FosE/FosI family fosfomycin resistance thiol transferase [Roseibium litorale]